ncbi:MAG: N-acetylneuraminate synthase family protein [Candidatus Aureabacteria bacterium]|nr:N-acetylneuraminate synthase family protein [Candidatus Auribacterota bacterium]
MNRKKIRIIAEVASNHGGELELAKEFIRTAAECGVDCVKFQSSRYDDLEKKDDPQAEWVSKTTLSDEAHLELMEECRRNEIDFLTTCFSLKRADFLASLGLKEIKVASPDLLSFRMLKKLALSFEHLIISTGMHSLREISSAIDYLTKNKINATLLHSVSLYPTPLEKAYMNKFEWLRSKYPHVGYSNHVPGITPILYAMSHGAEIIEAHMKLGERGPGRATPWDLLPEQFRQVVSYRDELITIHGEEAWIRDEDFLFQEEVKAKDRFIGRFGDNA